MKSKGNKCVPVVKEQKLLRRAVFWLGAETMKEAKKKSCLQDGWEKNDRPLIKNSVCRKAVCGPGKWGRQQTNFLLDGQPRAK